jgi:sugar-specific transcriptional regulator TrmB
MVQNKPMFEDTSVLRDYFEKLGLEAEIADLYLALHAYGPQTISDLARNANIERTRVYRLLETITETGLIEVETHYKRSILKAAPVSNLQILLSKKEEDLRTLQSELPSVQQAVLEQQQKTHTTQVQYYRGIEGLKQMFWNETKSTTENLSILYENMQNRTNSAFFERWVRELNRRQITTRGIVGEHFLKTQKDWYKQKDNERLAYWGAHYISPAIFTITHSTVIYNDIVAYYNWREGNIFGIEIHNQEIANAQRQFFELLWQQSMPLPNSVSQQLKEEA